MQNQSEEKSKARGSLRLQLMFSSKDFSAMADVYTMFVQQRERYAWTSEELEELLVKLIKTEEETVFGARLLLQKVTQRSFTSWPNRFLLANFCVMLKR